MNKALILFCLAIAILAIDIPAGATSAVAPAPVAPRWEKETLELFATLPIQEGGRVKPLATFARFKLVKLSGRTSCKVGEQGSLGALEWLLDMFFYPAAAEQLKVFRIENPAVMQALGLPDTEKRASFSFAQLRPVEERMMEMGRQYSNLEAKQRDIFQTQVLNLCDNYMDYQALSHAFAFARFQVTTAPGSPLANCIALATPTGIAATETPSKKELHFPYLKLLTAAPALLLNFHLEEKTSATATQAKPFKEALSGLEEAANQSMVLAILPPVSNPKAENWLSPGSLLRETVVSSVKPQREIGMLAQLNGLPQLLHDPAGFKSALKELHGEVVAAARERGEYRHIGLEVLFYRCSFFTYSLTFFILGFLALAFSWLVPRSRILFRGAAALIVLATVLLVVGITIRCIIRGRPPVTTLYETTLFVPAVAIVVALIVEFISRKRLALNMAAILGVAGLFVANQYELKDGADTMGSMVAVLNSNFWLATHVTTIAIGYSAGLLAGALAHLYVFARLFGRKKDLQYFSNLAGMVYGVVCFGTFFSFLGTVLGGIWANSSWGRFWGWDPKENGALLLILWNLIILHARLGGYIRDLGLCLAAIGGAMVVAFSWWGVNLLGVGLHSYGFTSGVLTWLVVYWTVESVVILLGLATWRQEWLAAPAPAKKPAKIPAGRV